METETSNVEIHPFRFTGKGGEYFKIWIVNILLSIVTVGIYSAWAKVRTQRYFLGNTFFQDHSFEYHAKGIDILKGRILAFIAVLLYTFSANFSPVLGGIMVILWGLLLPWAIWSSFRFNARVTSYRTVRFNFSGKVGQAYKVLLFLPLIPILIGGAVAVAVSIVYDSNAEITGLVLGLTMLAFYFFLPYVQSEFTRYYLNHLQYGQGDFSAKIKSVNYYKIYLALFLWAQLAVLVIAAAGFFASKVLGGAFETLNVDDPASFQAMIPFAFPALLGLLFLSLGVKAYLKSRIRNYAYSQIIVDDVLEIKSALSARKLFVVYVWNFVVIAMTLGLAIPWVRVSLARISAQSITATSQGDIGEYINQLHKRQSAIGDELGDAFDMPSDIGFSL